MPANLENSAVATGLERSVFKHHLGSPPKWYINSFTRNIKINDRNELTRKEKDTYRRNLWLPGERIERRGSSEI